MAVLRFSAPLFIPSNFLCFVDNAEIRWKYSVGIYEKDIR